jgi:hypothetical protein
VHPLASTFSVGSLSVGMSWPSEPLDHLEFHSLLGSSQHGLVPQPLTPDLPHRCSGALLTLADLGVQDQAELYPALGMEGCAGQVTR